MIQRMQWDGVIVVRSLEREDTRSSSWMLNETWVGFVTRCCSHTFRSTSWFPLQSKSTGHCGPEMDDGISGSFSKISMPIKVEMYWKAESLIPTRKQGTVRNQVRLLTLCLTIYKAPHHPQITLMVSSRDSHALVEMIQTQRNLEPVKVMQAWLWNAREASKAKLVMKSSCTHQRSWEGSFALRHGRRWWPLAIQLPFCLSHRA